MKFHPAEGYIVCHPAHRQFGRFDVCKVEGVSGYSTVPAQAEVVVPPNMHEGLDDGFWLVSTKAIVGWFPTSAELKQVA